MTRKAKALDLNSFSTTIVLLRKLFQNLAEWSPDAVASLSAMGRPALSKLHLKKSEVDARLVEWESWLTQLPKPINKLSTCLSFLR